MDDDLLLILIVWAMGVALALWVSWTIIRSAVKSAIIMAHKELRLDDWIDDQQDQRANRKSSEMDG